MSVVIYTKPGCPYCRQARDYYNAKGIPFIDYDAQNDKERQREMLALTGGDPTVPAIVDDPSGLTRQLAGRNTTINSPAIMHFLPGPMSRLYIEPHPSYDYFLSSKN
jgi:glutaredoxin 3